MKKIIINFVLILIFSSTCFAEEAGNTVTGDTKAGDYIQDSFQAASAGSEVIFTYDSKEIYQIYCQDGFLTDIRFQPGERITYVGGGDTTRWILDKSSAGAASDHVEHLYIKPIRRGISTNIIVNTSRRTYQLIVTASSYYNPMVSWVFPHELNNVLLRNLEERTEDNFLAVNMQKLNFNYTVNKHNYTWSPQQVFDDGQKTYLKMKPELSTGDAPAFFIKNSRGQMVLVNYRVMRGYYIVDRLFDRACLVVGNEKIEIKKK